MWTENLNILEKRKNLLNFAKKFIEICKHENIWYSLDRQTLKGSQKHGGFVPWEQRFEVMVTINSYRKLKRVCQNHIVDSFLDPSFKQLAPVFVANNRDWKSPQPFIRIRILIPTTTQKLQRFFSFWTLIQNKLRRRPQNIKNIINDLVDWQKFEGYYLFEQRRRFLKQNWIQVLSFETKTVNFSGIQTEIIKEYDRILKYWYGQKYLEKTSIPQIWYNYKSPFLREKRAN